MEVRQQEIDRAEPIAGHDEQSGFPGKGPDLAAFGRRGFQQA